MYGNEDGLINQIAAVSLTKSFGKKLSEIPVPDTKLKKDLKIANTIPEKDLLELDALKKLNKQLQEENTKLKAQNEKLKLLSTNLWKIK